MSDTEERGEVLNRVQLVGRLSRLDAERELPSGSMVVGFAVVVAREESGANGRTQVDSLDCAAWSAATRRSVRAWQVGDIVEVEGRLRRRFYRAASGGPASRYEVEVVRAKRRRRASAA